MPSSSPNTTTLARHAANTQNCGGCGTCPEHDSCVDEENPLAEGDCAECGACAECIAHCAREREVPAVPPAWARYPLPILEAAVEGAKALDDYAGTPQGRNLIAHALTNLARDGYLRSTPFGETLRCHSDDPPQEVTPSAEN